MKKQRRLWKNLKRLITVRRKEYSIWHINKDFYLENSESLLNLKKCITRKSVRKVSKTQGGNEFKQSWLCINMLELF